MSKLRKPHRPVSSKKRPIIFNSWSKLLFDGLAVRNHTTACTPQYLVKGCSCSRYIVKTGCMRKDCIECNPRLNLRRADNAFRKFQAYRKELMMKRRKFRFCYTDFTIPPALRNQFAEPKAWQKLRLAVWHILRDRFGAVFAVEASHPIGDENPNVFHPHMNFLWCPKSSSKAYIDVKVLNSIFANCLNYNGPVNVFHTYGDENAQLFHWCKYVTRIFADFADWTGSLRWYGRTPKCPKPEPMLCPCCGYPILTIGCINEVLIDAYDRYGFRLGRSPPWEDDKNITFFKSKKVS